MANFLTRNPMCGVSLRVGHTTTCEDVAAACRCLTGSYNLVTLCNAFHLNHMLLHFDTRCLARASQLSYSFFFFFFLIDIMLDKFKRIKIFQKIKKEKVRDHTNQMGI